MNSLERVMATVHFKKPDRIPVIAQVFGHAAILAEVCLVDYLRNGELLASCQLKALEQYDYDAVFALMDVNVETEALGSVLDYRSDQYPFITTYAVDHTNLDHLSVPDPERDGRMPELLKAVRILSREVGDDVLVVGCVLGPMTLAAQLLGIEKTLYLAIDDCERFARLLDFAAEVSVRFGVAQIEAGAHLPIVFDPASSPDVIPPSFYRELVLPRLHQVFTAFKQAGAIVNWLHTTGPVLPILPFYSQAGVELANLDFCVSPLDAMQILPRICLNGNIKPFSFIESTPAEIIRESIDLMNLFTERGGFILSSGCEIPLESKKENIAALVRASHQEM